MSIREKFEERYGGFIELCSDEVLEMVDALLNMSEDLEKSNEGLRKRISSLERENNVLKSFYSDNTISDEGLDDIDGVMSDLSVAKEALDRIKGIIDSACGVCSDVSASMEKYINSRNECAEMLSGSLDMPSANSTVLTDDELEDIPAPEPILVENTPDDDITQKLKNMLSEDAETAATEINTVETDDDFSQMILKFFSEDTDAVTEEAPEEPAEVSAEEPTPAPEKIVFEEPETVREEPEQETVGDAQEKAEERIEGETAVEEPAPAEPMQSVAESEPVAPSLPKGGIKSIRDSLAKIKSKRIGK